MARKTTRDADEPSKAAARTIGKRFTKRDAYANGLLLGLDYTDYFDLERAKSEALEILNSAGYKTADLYAPDGACFALERVRLASENYVDDSPAGLAAQVLQHCRELELGAEDYRAAPIGELWKWFSGHGYSIGRCLAFAKAYRVLAADGAKGGRPPKVDPVVALKALGALQSTWHPSPTQEAARQLGTSDRAIRKIAAKSRKKRS